MRGTLCAASIVRRFPFQRIEGDADFTRSAILSGASVAKIAPLLHHTNPFLPPAYL